MLGELKTRGWTPGNSADGGPSSREADFTGANTASRELGPPLQHGVTLLDWGCGSGIAGRRVVAAFGAAMFSRLVLHDHSGLALDFAEHRARQAFPDLTVERASTRLLRGDEPIGLLVISHVVNELDDIAKAELADLAARAEAILWVEPGTHEMSRALGSWRERLRDRFHLAGPCPHQAACGVLAPGNERHWCHFFAAPPAGVYADSGWVRFGQRAGIDLRSLPYAFLALDRRPSTFDPGYSRIIGEPRLYKGYAKIFNCDAGGVAELMLQKRDAPGLLKAFKHDGAGPDFHRWTTKTPHHQSPSQTNHE
ncbi:MAG: class I SAM-dependent methyltransferase [Lacunisphaera sp.]